jgi:hypothetical protein
VLAESVGDAFMGVLTHYFAATATEVASLDIRRGAGDWPRVILTNGVTDAELDALEHVLCGVELQALHARQPEWAGEESADGPWLMKLSKPLVDDLAAVSEAELPQLARRWAATDELTSKRVSAADVEPFLAELAALARAAGSEGRDLYLWISL